MNKKETTIVVLLFAALIAWMVFQPKPQPRPPTPVPAVAEGDTAAGAPAPAADTGDAGAPALAVESPGATLAPVVDPAIPLPPKQTLTLADEWVTLTLSSHGATIEQAVMPARYRAVRADPTPLTLAFTNAPALRLEGLPGWNRLVFDLTAAPSGAVATAQSGNGMRITRAFSLLGGYRVLVRDTFVNNGTEAVTLPTHSLHTGAMGRDPAEPATMRESLMGVDVLPQEGGAKAAHWGPRLPGLFGFSGGFMSCGRVDATHLKARVEATVSNPVAWVAAKNKFFTQIITPENGATEARIAATRDMTAPATFLLAGVEAAAVMPAATLAPGEEYAQTYTYYIGPKKYEHLRNLGLRQSEIMEFGFFTPLCKLLLVTLNGIHRVLPNYGVAIILLTLLVRLVFWPVTHKSNESMKKMQKLQPELASLREKFKNEPQKLNQATLELYRIHKVNPMSGCLPMLIQIPVFIALFNVLRSAVELRYAGFLWIRDLSAPEGLLAGLLPFGINILPLLMTATTIWQQKLTPAAGDPQQQRMMAMMPVVFLFIFYNMASALVLYWTVSQFLSIVQLLWPKWKMRLGWAAPEPKITIRTE